jgi:hypothetical protein
MATGSRNANSGDVVLEGRHLIGLFVMMVVIFGVVFVLGYELGRNQVGQQVNAASKAPDMVAATQPAPKPTELLKRGTPSSTSSSAAKDTLVAGQSAEQPAPADWDFYKAGDSQPPDAHLEKPAKIVSSKTKPAPSASVQAHQVAPQQTEPVKVSAKPQPSLSAPLLPRGSILLQIAALTRQSDALAMAQVLQQKRFPAVVVPPGADRFFHVQVGPYPDMAAANQARQALENEGFKSIIKR